MSDISSSTPSLTPQSTGTQDSSPPAPTMKSRPQAAFYPNSTAANKEQKPFSRSAAKRGSVMALGSIEHLQHYFTKTGLIAKKESNARRRGLVPAIGTLNTHTKASPSLTSLQELDLPPSPPAIPVQPHPAFIPYVKTFEVDPENLRPGVIHDLTVVEDVWRLRAGDNAQSPDPGLLTVHARTANNGFDVLRALKVTTHAIRSVRNYLLSLPDEHGSSAHPRQGFRPTSLSTSEPQKRRVFSGTDRTDPLARIRHAALEVLTVLRELEESARVPLSDDAYDAGSDHSSQSRVASPAEMSDGPSDVSFSVSVMRVGGRRESILVWDEEEDDFNVDEESERLPRERWDERLVLGSGWLYRSDLKFEDLEKQQRAAAQYLDAVDEVLFGGSKGRVRGWLCEQERIARRERLDREARGKGRRSSAPLPEPDSGASEAAGTVRRRRGDAFSMDDNDLPRWARREAFPDGEYQRTHALLLLNVLSSGQLLCITYNAGRLIHDIAALENALSSSKDDESQTEKRRKGWTFRRTDNLHVPMLKPNQTNEPALPPPSPSVSKFSEPPIFFDARLVARRDDGWDDMLERTLLRWTLAVVEERRCHPQ
ncbi:hypothetical protein BGW80DRAFT_1299516 [Lactifluus volemus]|nr:hypothetical protein BGW80DRAFT_1299516 [Lactifluus volemus]